jgi:hypothetical protein
MGSTEKTCPRFLFSYLSSVDIEYQRDPNLNCNNIRVHSHNRITNPVPHPLSLLPPSAVPFPFSITPLALALLKIYYKHSLCVLFLLLKIWARPLGTVTLHCTENSIYVYSEMKLRGLVPNPYIHVSVSDVRIYLFWQDDTRNI